MAETVARVYPNRSPFFRKLSAAVHDCNLSIVIPIDMHRRSWDIYKRIKSFIHAFAHSDIHLILGCNAQPQFWMNRVKSLIRPHQNIELCVVNAEACSLSQLRNVAIDAVQTPYVMFLDIDIVPDLATIRSAYYDVLTKPNSIGMFPCLYLTKAGSKKIKTYSTAEFVQHYFHFRRDLILHLAFPSSIVITDIQSVREIGGFDEQFIGHGYEDFDFMLRLFKHKGLIEYSSLILIDEPYLAPLMSVGLRAVMAKPFLENLITSNYFLHKFHPKDKAEDYYQQRELNNTLFKRKYQNYADSQYIENRLALLNYFFDHVIQHKNSPKYAALWAEIKGWILRNT